MGLSIWSSDDVKHFNIGYLGFTFMRSFFVLSYKEDLYDDYNELIKWSTNFDWVNKSCPIDEEKFYEKLGDLSILINHSDADGELSSDECEKLLKTLIIDEDIIRESKPYFNNKPFVEDMIVKMYLFRELIEYCSQHNDVKLIFG